MNLLDAYRYLASLEEHRHFGRAAQACHITQPALSNALRALESHLGVAIVRRGRLYEGLTPEGEQVLATAHRMLREQEALRQELHSGSGSPQGNLVIGVVPTAVPVATRFATELSVRHAGLRVQVRSLSSQEIDVGLDHLAIDLGMGYVERLDAKAREAVQVWPQFVEHYFLVSRAPVRAPHLQFAEPVTWADAARSRLCLLTAEMYNRVVLDDAFRRAGIRAESLIETNSVLALLVAVQEEGMAAILPGALVSVALEMGQLCARPLTQPDVSTSIAFFSARHSRPTRALEAALALATESAWLQRVRLHTGPLA